MLSTCRQLWSCNAHLPPLVTSQWRSCRSIHFRSSSSQTQFSPDQSQNASPAPPPLPRPHPFLPSGSTSRSCSSWWKRGGCSSTCASCLPSQTGQEDSQPLVSCVGAGSGCHARGCIHKGAECQGRHAVLLTAGMALLGGCRECVGSSAEVGQRSMHRHNERRRRFSDQQYWWLLLQERRRPESKNYA